MKYVYCPHGHILERGATDADIVKAFTLELTYHCKDCEIAKNEHFYYTPRACEFKEVEKMKDGQIKCPMGHIQDIDSVVDIFSAMISCPECKNSYRATDFEIKEKLNTKKEPCESCGGADLPGWQCCSACGANMYMLPCKHCKAPDCHGECQSSKPPEKTAQQVIAEAMDRGVPTNDKELEYMRSINYELKMLDNVAIKFAEMLGNRFGSSALWLEGQNDETNGRRPDTEKIAIASYDYAQAIINERRKRHANFK